MRTYVHTRFYTHTHECMCTHLLTVRPKGMDVETRSQSATRRAATTTNETRAPQIQQESENEADSTTEPVKGESASTPSLPFVKQISHLQPLLKQEHSLINVSAQGCTGRPHCWSSWAWHPCRRRCQQIQQKTAEVPTWLWLLDALGCL